MRNPDEETPPPAQSALRPFILRRTKEQVARELPSKTEQTVYCELEPEQRKLYDELRQHYRDSLLRQIETAGLAKSKIQVWRHCCACGKLLAIPACSIRNAPVIPGQAGRAARATA